MNNYFNSVSDLPDIVKAAFKSDLEIVKQLLDNGVDPNTVDPRDNLTLLHIACLQGDDDLVSVLFEHDEKHGNLDFTIRSSYRPRLAWQFAANGNHLALAERVHKAGVDKAMKVTEQSPPTPNLE